MAQISPTLRIALVVTVSFVVLWFAALKPKAPANEASDAPAPAATAGPQSDAGKTVQLAEGARDTASADAARAAATGGGTTATATEVTPTGTAPTATAPPAAPPVDDAALNQLPAPVARALRERDVLVLLFHDGGRSADDRAVRRAVARVEGKRVRTHTATLASISRYASLTRGAAVSQSPTVVVVDGQRKVETLVGFVDRETIAQAVTDAVRASRR